VGGSGEVLRWTWPRSLLVPRWRSSGPSQASREGTVPASLMWRTWKCSLTRWEAHPDNLRAFFPPPPTDTGGDAKLFYLKERDGILAEMEVDGWGRVVFDTLGRPVPAGS